MAELISASEAARRLGKPQLQRTLARRAREAAKRGDTAVQRIGWTWAANMDWWEAAAKPKKPGRKPY